MSTVIVNITVVNDSMTAEDLKSEVANLIEEFTEKVEWNGCLVIASVIPEEVSDEE
jgi:hypothetical protein